MSPRQQDSVYRTLRRLGRQFQALNDAVLVLDAEGFVADANRAATEVFAASKIVLCQQHISDLVGFDVGEADSLALDTGVQACKPLRTHGRRLTGEEFAIDVTLSHYPLQKSDGAAKVVVVRDLTHEHRITQIATHRERLASVGEVAAEVAHELSNPLTGITTIAEELLHTCRDSDRDMLHLIKCEAERAASIIHELLYFSRGDEEKPVIMLNDVVERALNLFDLRGRSANYEVTSDIAREATAIRANPTQVEQVIINLLNNAAHAVRAQEEGRISICTRAEADRVTLEVSDNGEGIPPEIQGQIFEPFFTTKEPGVGTGLGLAIVANIVRESGGQISVRSNPDAGTSFLVSLPRATQD